MKKFIKVGLVLFLLVGLSGSTNAQGHRRGAGRSYNHNRSGYGRGFGYNYGPYYGGYYGGYRNYSSYYGPCYSIYWVTDQYGFVHRQIVYYPCW